MASPFRTKEMTERHEAYKKMGKPGMYCALCMKETIVEFVYWKIVENRFPYDAVSSLSQILVTKRHTIEAELNLEEKNEFLEIKKAYLYKNYNYIIECMPKEMSLPNHYHVHLLVK